MDSLSRMISIFDLFTEEKSVWSAEEVAVQLACSLPTAYRYLKVLTTAGLLAPEAGGVFGLGARVIELDRKMRLTDPMLGKAMQIMDDLSRRIGENLLLCGFYGSKVICTAHAWPNRSLVTSYDRGRPMPLLRGAAGKAILAYLPHHRLRSLMLNQPAEVAAAGLGTTWAAFRDSLKAIRRQGYVVSYGEIDSGIAGVAAPILGESNRIVGSLIAAVPEARLPAQRVEELAPLVIAAAKQIAPSEP